MHVIAAKAVALQPAPADDYREDQRRTIENARRVTDARHHDGMRVVSGGTDNHLMLVDVTPLRITGKEAQASSQFAIADHGEQERHPLRPSPPNIASGIRLGTPAVTSRGFGGEEGDGPASGISSPRRSATHEDPSEPGLSFSAHEVAAIADRFPLPNLPEE